MTAASAVFRDAQASPRVKISINLGESDITDLKLLGDSVILRLYNLGDSDKSPFYYIKFL